MSVFEKGTPGSINDAAWLETLAQLILKNIENPGFSVEKLSELLAMSRPVLFRKCKNITGKSPQHYIKHIRLQKSLELLKQRKLNINEVAYACGFGDPKYFSTSFKKNYGKTPTQYLKEQPL